MKYFVMLVGRDGSPIPMIDSSDEDKWGDKTALFNTQEEADSAGRQNLFGRTYGYEVMEWCWMEED